MRLCQEESDVDVICLPYNIEHLSHTAIQLSLCTDGEVRTMLYNSIVLYPM